MTTAEMIKAKRESLGMTQEELAEKTEVSRQAVSKWEKGISVPTEENLKRLGDALGVSEWPKKGQAADVDAVPGKKSIRLWDSVRFLRVFAAVGWTLALALVFILSMGAGHRTFIVPGATPSPTVTPTPRADYVTVFPQPSVTPSVTTTPEPTATPVIPEPSATPEIMMPSPEPTGAL